MNSYTWAVSTLWQLLMSVSICLSNEARGQYKSKVAATGLSVDPYVIENWTEDPRSIPRLVWSDVTLYMVSTPRVYTKKAIKVDTTLANTCVQKVDDVFALGLERNSDGCVRAGWVHDLRSLQLME